MNLSTADEKVEGSVSTKTKIKFQEVNGDLRWWALNPNWSAFAVQPTQGIIHNHNGLLCPNQGSTSLSLGAPVLFYHMHKAVLLFPSCQLDPWWQWRGHHRHGQPARQCFQHQVDASAGRCHPGCPARLQDQVHPRDFGNRGSLLRWPWSTGTGKKLIVVMISYYWTILIAQEVYESDEEGLREFWTACQVKVVFKKIMFLVRA